MEFGGLKKIEDTGADRTEDRGSRDEETYTIAPEEVTTARIGFLAVGNERGLAIMNSADPQRAGNVIDYTRTKAEAVVAGNLAFLHGIPPRAVTDVLLYKAVNTVHDGIRALGEGAERLHAAQSQDSPS